MIVAVQRRFARASIGGSGRVDASIDSGHLFVKIPELLQIGAMVPAARRQQRQQAQSGNP
jgi:hypothetical protein